MADALTYIALAAVTFGLGALVARWWVLLVVLVPGLGLTILAASEGTEQRSDGSGVDWAVGFFLPATLVAAALMALGVACRRHLGRGARKPARHRSPTA
jgi:hypothetical protein